MSFLPRKIIYFYPASLPRPPVEWHTEFPDIPIEYDSELPMDEDWWATVPKDTLIVIDDNWEIAANSSAIANTFKVFARHGRYSVIIVSQSYFERGPYSIVIRNNLNAIALFESSSNLDVNTRVAKTLGYSKEFKLAKKIYNKHPYSYVLFNVHPRCPKAFRICTNLFSEHAPFYPMFHSIKR